MGGVNRTLKTLSIKSLIINCSTDDFSINDLLVLLGANGQGVCHQIVNEMGIALTKAVCSRKSYWINDGGGCTCKRQFVQDVTFRGTSLASTDFSNAILDMVEFDEDNVGVITDACAKCRI